MPNWASSSTSRFHAFCLARLLVIHAGQMKHAVQGQVRVVVDQAFVLFSRFPRYHGAQSTRSPINMSAPGS